MAVNNVKQEQFLSQWALKVEANTIYCFHLLEFADLEQSFAQLLKIYTGGLTMPCH